MFVFKGNTWFESKVDIEVSKVSQSAIKAVERQGGKVVCAHYNKLGLRVLLKPEKWTETGRPLPRRARPPSKLMAYYTNPRNRGYLADPSEVEKLREALQKRRLESVD